MAEIFSIRPSEHEAVQQLLPWYVNNTLSKGETDRVEAHLADCEECRAQLEFDRTLATDVAMLPLNVESGWQAMQERIAAEQRPSSSAPMRFLRTRVSLPTAVGGALAASLAVAAAVLSLQVNQLPGHTYRTLGSPAPSSAGQLVVLFKPTTTEQQMRVILSSHGAHVVDGPTAAGAYVLRLDQGSADEASRAFRQSSEIVLAEPLSGDGRP